MAQQVLGRLKNFHSHSGFNTLLNIIAKTAVCTDILHTICLRPTIAMYCKIRLLHDFPELYDVDK